MLPVPAIELGVLPLEPSDVLVADISAQKNGQIVRRFVAMQDILQPFRHLSHKS